ncbi:MAG: flagellin [Methanomicrobiaceae archaeon]|nr:flagellin [Methanomicrobiaceae archaeon]
MSSDSFTTAIFLITAIVAAAVLVNAFFPIIYTATDTFSSSSVTADERLRTDVKIVNSYASTPAAKVWVKNVGSIRIADNDIDLCDVFAGVPGNFDILVLNKAGPGNGEWDYEIIGDSNEYWDVGETLRIDIASTLIPGSGSVTYFHFVLPSGITRTTEFTAS